MKRGWLLFLLLPKLVVAAPPATISGISGRIDRIATDAEGGFHAIVGPSIYRLVGDHFEHERTIRDPDTNYTITDIDLWVTPAGIVKGYYASHYSPERSDATYYRLHYVVCRASRCRHRTLRSGNLKSSHTTIESTALDRNGALYLVESYAYKNGKRWHSQTSWYRDGAQFKKEQGTYPEIRLAFLDEELVTVKRTYLGNLEIESRGISLTVPGVKSYYTWHVLPSGDSLHLFHHDPATKSMIWTRWNRTTGQVESLPLDTQETGIESAPFLLPDGRIGLFYSYYRNPFNKGLRFALLENDRMVENVIIDRAADRNSGWHIAANANLREEIVVGFTSDLLARKVRILRYDGVENLIENAMPPPEQPWEKRYTTLFFLGGGGLFFTKWNMTSLPPDPEDDGVPPDKIYDATYTLSDFWMNEWNIEGKIGSLRIAATYLRSILRDEIEEAGGRVGKTAFDLFTGFVGWDDLFFHHDVKLSYRAGNFTGRFTDHSGLLLRQTGNASYLFEAGFKRYDVTLLNAYRLAYGLTFVQYRAFVPIYLYEIDEGSTSYHFLDSTVGKVKYYDIAIFSGYSKLDYVAKYETNYRGFFLDSRVGIGVSFADIEEKVVPLESDTGWALEILFQGEGDLGFLLYQRFHALHGFGGYLKFGARAVGSFAGLPGKPGDRDEPAEERSVLASFNRADVQWGGYLHAGLVF